jgi:ribonucleoside-diphosphate reductase alpha chain
MIKTVIKRSGVHEDFAPAKLNIWGKWASAKLHERLDWSGVVLEAVKTLPEVVTTQELQQKLIDVCISRKTWPYNLMAGRLYAATLQKEIHGYTLPKVKDLCKKLHKLKLMKKLDYTFEEWDEIEKIIDHTRDFEMAHFQIKYITNKYTIYNKVTKEFYETPQYTYMRMALALAESEDKDRLIHVKNWYDHFSKGRINAPTPNYVNLGTNHNGYASCCLYTTDDSAKSLAIGDHIAYTMTYMSAGIGSLLNIRTVGDPVKGGALEHQGKLKYFKSKAGAVNANRQGARGGADTDYYQCYDPEAWVISQLQNPKSTDDRKNRDIHFALITNRFFAKKVAAGENIFTFTSFSAPDLWDKLFSDDVDGFERLYNVYENNPLFVKNYTNARDFLINALQQSYEVGTHYLAFIDEMNRHTPYKEKIYSSNLCLEITQPTHPYNEMMDLYSKVDNGFVKFKTVDDLVITLPWSTKVHINGQETYLGEVEIGDVVSTSESTFSVKEVLSKRQTSEVSLCSLSGIVESNIESDEEYESATYYSLKMINKCIHLSDYPLPHIGFTAKKRMNAGVGLVGIAYSMAKKGLKYDSKEGLEELHRIAERHSYFLIKSSLRIAKETQPAPWIHKTKWVNGWLPIDTYKKTVDQIVNIPLQYDWESLRREIIENKGIAHSSLVAHMPTESSSKAVGVPNGIYPIRDLAMKKSDLSNIIDWVARDSDIYEDTYQLAWDIHPKDMIKVYSVFQKFADQSISADMYKDRTQTLELSTTDMIEEYLDMVRYGMKTRYYQNSLTSDQNNLKVQTNYEKGCSSGACDV